VVGGLITATLLNMVVVPTVYYRVERWREQRHPLPSSVSIPQESSS
jgi:Cu/Ag efflux pump CusA